jgi:putative sterol carrier protein
MNRMVLFPSKEWISLFKEQLNKNASYKEAAKDWEGDFLFVITPDNRLTHEVVFYVDLWHGLCKEARLAKPKEQAAFVFKGPYSNWKRVIQGELDPLRGLIRGLFTIDGDSKVILDQAKAAQELVNTAKMIPAEFEG